MFGPDQLCESHNDKEVPYRKTQLFISKSCNCVKLYHPLKQKKIKLHRLRFVSSSELIEIDNKNASVVNNSDIKILSKRYAITPIKVSKKQSAWSTESDVIEWLLSIKIKIKRKSSREFFLKDRVCFFNSVLVFANKKRVEMGIEPFYLEGLTEF